MKTITAHTEKTNTFLTPSTALSMPETTIQRPARTRSPEDPLSVAYSDDVEVTSIKRETERLFRNESKNVGSSLGMYLREIERYPVLTHEKEQYWAHRAQSGDEYAIQTLVCHNLRFVVAIAKRYSNHGVPLEDLIQCGNQGLMKAVRHFDPSHGVKMISYAIWWIRQSIHSALATQKQAFRLPINRASQLSKIHYAIARLTEQLGQRPSPHEIAEETGIPVSMTKLLLKAAQAELSLDATDTPEGGSDGIPLLERLAFEEGTEEHLARRFRIQELDKALGKIRSRDEKILRLFYGLDGGREHTLEEIGVLLGITRERVRQLRDRALRDLYRLEEADELEDLHRAS